jgi:hypothetical protein
MRYWTVMMKSPLIYRATGLEAYLIDPKEVQKLAPILKTSDIEVRNSLKIIFRDKETGGDGR